MSLDALCDPSRPICYGILKPNVEGEGEVPYVEVRDLRNLPLRVENLNRTSNEMDAEFARSRLVEGDVVVAIRGSYDIAAPVPAELDSANVSRDVARLAPLEGVDPRYLAYYITSHHTQQYFRRVARGVAVTGVNIGDLRQLPVPVPSLAVQRRIVEYVENELSRVVHVQQALRQSEDRAVVLRRAVLKDAFEGQLSRSSSQAQSEPDAQQPEEDVA